MDSVSSPPVVAVLIPTVLRNRTDNRASVSVAGRTVREVIEALEREYPGLRFNLCYETGELREYVNIFVGRENVRYLEHLETPVTSGTTIRIVQSVAGG
jgi:molybdopterin synthase sulfur carrier subunit